MMITIHGLPPPTKYADLKILIKQKCNITDFILDSLMADGTDGSKKVRVGLADDSEGAYLMKCLDGYRLSGYVLRLIPVAKSSQVNPQHNTHDMRGNYQQRHDYQQPNQLPDRSRPMEAPQPAPWGNQANTWQSNQPTHLQPQNTYSNYQQHQPVGHSYGQNMGPPVKPQFEQREMMQSGQRAPINQNYSHSYSQKSNLISLGQPQRTMPSSTVREVPEASERPVQGNRYPPQQNYNMPEKPVTIMKDNFQGPSQYNLLTGHEPSPVGYQPSTQPSGWSSQQQSKSFEKPLTPSFDKKLYEDRKYPSDMPIKPVSDLQKPDAYKSFDKSREFSPRRQERGYRRDITPERGNVSSSRQNTYSGRISPGRLERQAYADRRSPGHRDSPERRVSPPGRQGYPDSRRISPGYRVLPGRKASPGRRDSPGHRDTSGRRDSPGHRISPGRKVSPGRRVLPGRRDSPGRRISPGHRVSSGHRVTPGRIASTERRMSPSVRQVQERAPSPPHRRISPPKTEEYARGRISPPTYPADRRMRHPSHGRDHEETRGTLAHDRHESPRRQSMRCSPTRHHVEKPMPMEYQDSRSSIKTVRPAYEPAQASNEAKYSGGYRPIVREDAHYPIRGQERWQEKEFGHKETEDRREMSRLQKFDIPRASEQEPKRSRSRNRLSRSPRRDRSPIKDRVRRHSPSPRSPRRSWALEKRHSPDIREPPPPPVWPGQDIKNSEYQQHSSRPNFAERDQVKTSAVWQQSQDKKRDELIRQRAADREHFEEEMRRRQSTIKWKPVAQMSPKGTSRYVEDDRTFRDDKFVRKGFEERRDYREDDDESSVRKGRELREDRDEPHHSQDFKTKDNVLRNKENFAGSKEKFIEDKKKEILKKQVQLQKEIDEVYKRAVDFTKKAELYRKGELKKVSGSRRRDEDSSNSEDNYEEYSVKDDKVYSKIKRPHHGSIENKGRTSSPLKSKRITAIEQIADKIMTKYGNYLPDDMKTRVLSEIQQSVSRILTKMFGNEDVSFIEMVIKFNSKHTTEDEEAIFDAVMSSFPTHFRRPKRPAEDNCEVPSKSSRRTVDPSLNAGGQLRATGQNWPLLQNMTNVTLAHMGPPGILMGAPVMVPVPASYHFVQQPYQEAFKQPVVQETKKDGHSLYLCKDDFQPIEEYETAQLKEFLVKQLIKVTQTSHGWAPDFTLAKQHNAYRHEMITRDERSRDWLLSLDFSEFKLFNVLVYTTEELWYERAAVWLPGHSRYRNIDPLTKLKLQNKRLEGVNIGKWKFVKKIINEKGTRIYVDMPPSSARALEKYKMQLGYELQKVNVFLKAIAIDKEAFDAGLNEPSIRFLPPPSLTPMPCIPGKDKDIVQIAFKGNKPLTLVLARKVKDTIIYKMYKYHQLDGKSRTDFVKYGFCQPGYFCLLPENPESRKWICDLDLGKINRIPLIIVGEDYAKNKYFSMSINLPVEMQAKQACERLKQSNRGLKGINFSLWKNPRIHRDEKQGTSVLHVDMEVESIETIIEMKYKLDFVVENREYIATVESNLPRAKLEEAIAKYKSELSDKYDVANMDLASDSEEEIICLS